MKEGVLLATHNIEQKNYLQFKLSEAVLPMLGGGVKGKNRETVFVSLDLSLPISSSLCITRQRVV